MEGETSRYCNSGSNARLNRIGDSGPRFGRFRSQQYKKGRFQPQIVARGRKWLNEGLYHVCTAFSAFHILLILFVISKLR